MSLFLSGNLIKNSGVTFTASTGTINANFPLSNLLEDSTCKVVRSTTNTLNIDIDLQSLSTIDTFCIAGHNIDGLGFTACSLYLSPINDFSSSAEIVIDLNSTYNFGFKQITNGSYRYARLEFTGTGSYVEISNIYIGEAIEVEIENDIKYSIIANSDISLNQYSQKFISEKNTLKELDGSFKYLNSTEFTTLDDLFFTHLDIEPIWVILDPTGAILTDSEWIFSGYFYFKSVPKWSTSNSLHWNTNINLIEVV